MGVLIRCKSHEPQGRSNTYVAYAEPVGYPDTAVVCPSADHDENEAIPGLAYMHQRDFRRYKDGKRKFETPTAATDIVVSDRYEKLE